MSTDYVPLPWSYVASMELTSENLHTAAVSVEVTRYSMLCNL